MQTYFSLDEDFNRIIKTSLQNKNINSIKPISTGWTNIVFEVSTDDGNYFFRFPRDEFWIRTIVKDCEFSNYIHGKTSFNTVLLSKSFDNNRAYSIHKKIEGIPLAEKMNTMSSSEIKQVSNEIANFMFQLHNVEFNKDEIFKTNNIGLNLVDFLNELIEKHLSSNDKVFWKYKEFSNKENNCLVHGDFNSSNIIIDENNHISAIIDFGFAGFGNKYFDISRIIGRLPESFKNDIIKAYENLSNSKLDYDILDNEIKIWKDIDNGYINYMRGIGIYD